MALFSRKNADQRVLPEVERYYDAEKRERAGMAWFLAIASIACVALLLIGMFFGGRWIYRKAAHTNKKTGVSTTKITNTDIASSKNTAFDNTANDSSAAKTPTPTTPTPAPSTTPPTTPAPTPAVSNSTALANTGPTGTIAIFIASVFGFATLHNLMSRRRTN